MVTTVVIDRVIGRCHFIENAGSVSLATSHHPGDAPLELQLIAHVLQTAGERFDFLLLAGQIFPLLRHCLFQRCDLAPLLFQARCLHGDCLLMGSTFRCSFRNSLSNIAFTSS